MQVLCPEKAGKLACAMCVLIGGSRIFLFRTEDPLLQKSKIYVRILDFWRAFNLLRGKLLIQWKPVPKCIAGIVRGSTTAVRMHEQLHRPPLKPN